MPNMSIEEYKGLGALGKKRKYSNKKVYFNEYTGEFYEELLFKRLKKDKAVENIEKFIKFDSHLECRYYQELLILKKCGEVKYIELQPKFTLIPKFVKNGVTISAITYSADFKVSYSCGKVEIIDIKGMVTSNFRLRWKIFEYKYPDVVLKVIDKHGQEIPLYKNR